MQAAGGGAEFRQRSKLPMRWPERGNVELSRRASLGIPADTGRSLGSLRSSGGRSRHASWQLRQAATRQGSFMTSMPWPVRASCGSATGDGHPSTSWWPTLSGTISAGRSGDACMQCWRTPSASTKPTLLNSPGTWQLRAMSTRPRTRLLKPHSRASSASQARRRSVLPARGSIFAPSGRHEPPSWRSEPSPEQGGGKYPAPEMTSQMC